jgi:hypothetical protein
LERRGKWQSKGFSCNINTELAGQQAREEYDEEYGQLETVITFIHSS